MIDERYYIGTDLKFAFEIEGEGFDMATDKYDIDLVCGGKTVHVDVEERVVEDEGEFLLLVDTRPFPPGVLKMVATAYVPDENYSDGYREEVVSKELCQIKRP